ncbi:MAG: Gldg family protein [Rhodospirillales bacterium]|jgi:ABC-type uncharacterized transport system involved in gliding motility auxiliary subunit|nr:Gldg family protein [Rhodospirillales bacterium]MDP6805532.1 Gldg family protein [Rhodospirillales bacterium]
MRGLKWLYSLERGTLAGAGVVLAIILFVALNVLSTTTIPPLRLDLTANRLFTVSDGTKKALAAIDEPIKLRFYISRTISEDTGFGSYAARVRDLLDHYVSLSDGMLWLEVYNPDPYSAEEDEAVSFGLQGVLVNDAGDRGYFGLAARNSTDDREYIAFFDPAREPFLEYDLTRLIFDLANPDKKVVGIVGSLRLEQDPAKGYMPWPVAQQMKQFFQVRALGAEADAIGEDVGVLMVVHPGQLAGKTLYAIDQYVVAGGKAMFFVDPHYQSAPQQAVQQGTLSNKSDLAKLFDAWGVKFSADEVVGDRTTAIRVNIPGARASAADFILWMDLRAPNFNADDVVTDRINSVILAGAGHLEAKEGSALRLTPLITSGTQAMGIEADAVRFGPPDPVQLLNEFKTEDRAFTLAARFQGPIASAFPDGPPPAEAEDGDAAAEKTEDAAAPETADTPALSHRARSDGPVHLVVVADVDILEERFWMQPRNMFGQGISVPIANNADFVINVLDNLAGSDALIGLRSRGLSVRPFHRVEAMQRDAAERFRKTEQELLAKREETEKKLGEFQIDAGRGTIVLTTEQRTTIDNFRKELVSIRRQLRDVQHELRKDVEALMTLVRIVNIWAVPALVCVVAVILAVARRRRYGRGAPAG